jgi:hypothetical protein
LKVRDVKPTVKGERLRGGLRGPQPQAAVLVPLPGAPRMGEGRAPRQPAELPMGAHEGGVGSKKYSAEQLPGEAARGPPDGGADGRLRGAECEVSRKGEAILMKVMPTAAAEAGAFAVAKPAEKVRSTGALHKRRAMSRRADTMEELGQVKGGGKKAGRGQKETLRRSKMRRCEQQGGADKRRASVNSGATKFQLPWGMKKHI